MLWHNMMTETARFITVMKDIAEQARAEDAKDTFNNFPQSSPRRRLDEVKAARNPVPGWKRVD